MWVFSGSILLSAIIAVAFAAVAPPPAALEQIIAAVSSNQESISQLVDTVRTMTTTDEDMKRQLLSSANAIISSQTTLQQVLSGSSITTVTTSAAGAEGERSNEKDEEKKVTTTIKLDSPPVQLQANNNTLRDILDELKSLNSHFQEHLSTLSCPPPYVLVGEQCFAFILEDKTWADARAHCLKLGGDLAEPQNLPELRLYINTRYPRKGRRNFWLGGVNREKVWQWLSGGPMVEGFWYTNEPSGNGECLAMMDGWEYPLTDFPCENDRRSVCERVIKKKKVEPAR